MFSLVKPVGSLSDIVRGLGTACGLELLPISLTSSGTTRSGSADSSRSTGGRRLVVHAPAVMDAMVERNLDHFRRRRRAGVAHGAGEIDPVEAEDDIDILQALDALRRERARRAGIERMVGREARADLEIGDDAGIERLGERDARVPGFLAARGAAGQDQAPAWRL